MKRFITLVAAAVLLLNCLPVTAQSTEQKISLPDTTVMSEEQFRAYSGNAVILSLTDDTANTYSENGYYYSNLKNRFSGDEALLVYEKAMQGLEYMDGAYTVTVETDLLKGYSAADTETIQEILYAAANDAMAGLWCYRYDNPLVGDRFVNSVWSGAGYYTEGDIVTGSVFVVYMYEHSGYSNELAVARDEKIAEIAALADKKKTQYDAMLFIHDTLAEMTVYDNSVFDEYVNGNLTAEELVNTEEFFLAHSSFGILAGKEDSGGKLERKAVCEGYAKAFMEICQALENPPYVALLTSTTHMWNIVLLDGEWYCVDVTWDDGGSYIFHTYFLCGDPDTVDGELTDHIPDGLFTVAPEYAAEKYELKAVLGDITGDRTVNVLDIIRLKRLLIYSDTEISGSADLDNSSAVDALDLAYMKRLILGLDT